MPRPSAIRPPRSPEAARPRRRPRGPEAASTSVRCGRPPRCPVRHRVDARVGGPTRVVDRADLAEHERACGVRRVNERSGIRERVRDDAHPASDATDMSSARVGKMTDEADTEGPVGRLACAPNLLDDPLRAADRGAPIIPVRPQPTTAAASGAGASAATHRRVQYRVLDAEQVAQPGMHVTSFPRRFAVRPRCSRPGTEAQCTRGGGPQS